MKTSMQSLPGDSLWGCQATSRNSRNLLCPTKGKSQTHNIPVNPLHSVLVSFCSTRFCIFIWKSSLSSITVHLSVWLFLCCRIPQVGRGSVRLYLGTEAHERKHGHWLQTAGTALQTLQLAGLTFSLTPHTHTAARTCTHTGRSPPSACFSWHVTMNPKKKSSPIWEQSNPCCVITSIVWFRCHIHLVTNKASLTEAE